MFADLDELAVFQAQARSGTSEDCVWVNRVILQGQFTEGFASAKVQDRVHVLEVELEVQLVESGLQLLKLLQLLQLAFRQSMLAQLRLSSRLFLKQIGVELPMLV